jgi:hypothetical protein
LVSIHIRKAMRQPQRRRQLSELRRVRHAAPTSLNAAELWDSAVFPKWYDRGLSNGIEHLMD